jgi:hypothetical protein
MLYIVLSRRNYMLVVRIKKSFVKVLNFDKASKNLSNSEPLNLRASAPLNLFYKKSFSETPSFILISDILISNSKPTF